MAKNKVLPFLWYDQDLTKVARYYKSIFPQFKVLDLSSFSATFIFFGQKVMALNGGPHYKFSPAFSFFIECQNQKEIDLFWKRLTKGGKPLNCGWINDKYGLTWQVIPKGLSDWIAGDDKVGSARAHQAMLKMKKLDIKALKKAYKGH